MNSNPGKLLLPAAVFTCTVPDAPFERTALMVSLEITEKEVAGLPPNFTLFTFSKLAPQTVTV